MEINITEAWIILKAFSDMSDCLVIERDINAEEQLKGKIFAAIPEIACWLEKERTLYQLEWELEGEALKDPTVLKWDAEWEKFFGPARTGARLRGQKQADLFYSIREARVCAFENLWREATGLDYCREDLIRPWRENRQKSVEKEGEAM